MSLTARMRGPVAGAVLLVTGLAVLPAQAVAAGTDYTGWAQREDGSATGSDTTYALAGPDAVLSATVWDGRIDVTSSAGPAVLDAQFSPPIGQTLQVDRTYLADVSDEGPTSSTGRLMIWRDGTMCDRTVAEIEREFAYPAPPKVATGWFHVSELEYDVNGNVARFAATNEMNCQFLGGSLGFEGSVAVSSSQTAVPVPDVPVAPGPVTGLSVANVGPNAGGQNSTTLTWKNPEGFGDVSLDMVQVKRPFPPLLGAGDGPLYHGRADRYHEDRIDFMDTRTYRLVPRGTFGRLGPPTFVTVLGTRLATSDDKQRIMIGQQATVTGRLSESWDPPSFAEVMNGPGLVGRTVRLCRQPSGSYPTATCTLIDQATTTTDGRFALAATPRENSMYVGVVPATSTMIGNDSLVFTALVAPRTDLRASATRAARHATPWRVAAHRGEWLTVRRGEVIPFTTVRAPAGSQGVVRLQRLDGRTWRTIVTKRLGSRTASRRLALPYREHTLGSHSYRVVKPGNARHINGVSQIVRIRVR